MKAEQIEILIHNAMQSPSITTSQLKALHMQLFAYIEDITMSHIEKTKTKKIHMEI